MCEQRLCDMVQRLVGYRMVIIINDDEQRGMLIFLIKKGLWQKDLSHIHLIVKLENGIG